MGGQGEDHSKVDFEGLLARDDDQVGFFLGPMTPQKLADFPLIVPGTRGSTNFGQILNHTVRCESNKSEKMYSNFQKSIKSKKSI